jgi:hypothetical protein
LLIKIYFKANLRHPIWVSHHPAVIAQGEGEKAMQRGELRRLLHAISRPDPLQTLNKFKHCHNKCKQNFLNKSRLGMLGKTRACVFSLSFFVNGLSG